MPRLFLLVLFALLLASFTVPASAAFDLLEAVVIWK